MKQPYPESVMRILRQREGIEKTDTSRDDELQKVTSQDALYELCAWELGSRSWGSWFIERCNSVGITLNFPED